MLSWWQNIYSSFDPVAINISIFSIHWYGIMYVTALLSAFFIAKWFVKKDNLPIKQDVVDSYFLWAELAIIFGARVGYILIYDPNTAYYLTRPWQMFNPYFNGEFVGISGMSYHGALIGFLFITWVYTKKFKQPTWLLMDLIALSVPLAYVFGRIGNFLNKELIGRVTDVPWGIYIDGILRHPSQLYEAFLEGVVVFIIIYVYRKHKKFDGELICLYGFSYSICRFIAEFFREADAQMGYFVGGLTAGQILCIIILFVSIGLYFYLKSYNKYKKYKV
jgi:phosphatidylglycerol:prolipoprotein diacylglycerol transferase